jgi:hypothetical protein
MATNQSWIASCLCSKFGTADGFVSKTDKLLQQAQMMGLV